MNALIEKVRDGNDLNPADIGRAIARLLSDSVPGPSKTEFLRALHAKGETAEEIAGFGEQLISRAIDPMLDPGKLCGPMLDVCGTGGAGLGIFNVSTTIMFILAAGGACVVKHGNRRVTSCCGSADVLEALGVRLHWDPPQLRECVERHGLGFIFAPEYHPAFRTLARLRAEVELSRTRTIFNLLGPLLNPARPRRQLLGVYAPRLTTVFADVLRQLGRERAWVVHGRAETGAGMDDISTGGVTTFAELHDGRTTSALIDCRWLGVRQGALDELRGGDAPENAKTLDGILSGEITGAKRDLALVNAAAGFVIADIVHDLKDGIAYAAEQINSGRAHEKLRALQELSVKV